MFQESRTCQPGAAENCFVRWAAFVQAWKQQKIGNRQLSIVLGLTACFNVSVDTYRVNPLVGAHFSLSSRATSHSTAKSTGQVSVLNEKERFQSVIPSTIWIRILCLHRKRTRPVPASKRTPIIDPSVPSNYPTK